MWKRLLIVLFALFISIFVPYWTGFLIKWESTYKFAIWFKGITLISLTFILLLLLYCFFNTFIKPIIIWIKTGK